MSVGYLYCLAMRNAPARSVQNGVDENVMNDLGSNLNQQYLSRDNHSLIAICDRR